MKADTPDWQLVAEFWIFAIANTRASSSPDAVPDLPVLTPMRRSRIQSRRLPEICYGNAE
jgi:hypothetical protein